MLDKGQHVTNSLCIFPGQLKNNVKNRSKTLNIIRIDYRILWGSDLFSIIAPHDSTALDRWQLHWTYIIIGQTQYIHTHRGKNYIGQRHSLPDKIT